MKYLLLTATVIFMAISAHSQVKPFPVAVTDWRYTSAVLTPEWWPGVKDKVKDQLSAEDYKRLVNYNPWGVVPPEMTWAYFTLYNGKDSAAFMNKMNELKCYQIASYFTSSSGKPSTEKVILKIPYEENRRWNDTIKWDILYLVINKSYVRQLDNQ